jgi:chemotaxis signal transduction protein
MKSTVSENATRAALREQVRSGTGSVHCLMFRKGPETFAIPLDRIAEAVDGAPIQQVPDMPPGTIGAIGVAGRTIPVVDGSELLGVASSERNLSVLMFRAPRSNGSVPTSSAPVIALAVDELLTSAEIDLSLVRRVVALEDQGGIFAGVTFCDGLLVTLLDPDSFVRMNAFRNADFPELR